MEPTLDLYRNAARYDRVSQPLAVNGADAAFFRRQAAQFGPSVLELACGSGRLAIPLAMAGFDVTGVDASPEMLALGRAKAGESRLICHQADIRAFHLNRKFGLIFIGNNSLSHLLERAHVEQCFACVHEHLEPGGRFIVDVFNPSLAILTRDSAQDYPVTEYEDAESGVRVVVTETSRYDPASQVKHIRWRFSSARKTDDVVPLSLRIFYPQELDGLLEYNGFAIEHKYGTYGEDAFRGDSPKQIVVCRATPC